MAVEFVIVVQRWISLIICKPTVFANILCVNTQYELLIVDNMNQKNCQNILNPVRVRDESVVLITEEKNPDIGDFEW